jgi:hypothetical protein
VSCTSSIELSDKALEELPQDWYSNIIEPKTTSKKHIDIESLKSKRNNDKLDNIELTIKKISEIIDFISKKLKLNNLLKFIPVQIKHLIIVPHYYLPSTELVEKLGSQESVTAVKDYFANFPAESYHNPTVVAEEIANFCLRSENENLSQLLKEYYRSLNPNDNDIDILRTIKN